MLWDGDESREFSGYMQGQTKHKLAIYALIRALESVGHIKPSTFLGFHTDDGIVADALAGKIDQWKAKGWKAKRGRSIENAAWWKRVWILLRRFNGAVTHHPSVDDESLLARAIHLSKVAMAQEAHVSVYVDGSFLPKSRVGGWGAIILTDGEVKQASGGMLTVDNNAAELVGVIEALEALPDGQGAIVHTDSQYVSNGFKQLATIQMNNWMYPGGRPISNPKLWSKLYDLTRDRHVRIEWVKGHSGVTHNVAADRLAGEEARALAERLPEPACR